MSEHKMSQMQWCNESLMNTREELMHTKEEMLKLKEELDASRRMNFHLTNQLDKQKEKIDGIYETIRQQATNEISAGMALSNIKMRVGWRY